MAAWNESGREEKGFWAWVKRPWIRRREERQLAREEEELRRFDPDRCKPAEITQLLEQLLTHKLMWPIFQKFEMLGKRAVPQLLQVLGDPRFLLPYPSSKGEDFPITEVLSFLDNFRLIETLPRLVELSTHSQKAIRCAVASSLGKLGMEEALAPWLALTQDPDNDVRCSAIWGVRLALEKGEVSKEFARVAHDVAVELLNYQGETFGMVEAATYVAIQTDPVHALQAILEPKRFTPRNPNLIDILEIADKLSLPLPADRVIALMTEIRPDAECYTGGRQIGHLLRILANQRSEQTREWVAELSQWASPNSQGAREIQQACAEALAILSGVKYATETVLQRVDAATSLEEVPLPVKRYYIAWYLNAQILNGGLAQYFVNSPSGGLGEEVAVLEGIGAFDHAAILRRALELFGPSGPARDRDDVHQQLAAMTPAQDAVMSQLDTEYYSLPDEMETFLARYVCQHPEYFQSGTSS